MNSLPKLNNVLRGDTGDYGISRTVELPFSEAVLKIKESLAAEGFGVLTEIDMKAKFKEKLGEEFENYLILGACNPSYAFKALNMDMDLGLLLPCNVVVYEKEGKTVVAAIDPVKMMSVADNADLKAIAGGVETKLRKALDRI